jgi:hypothetical protein
VLELRFVPNLGRCRVRYASAPSLREGLVMVARKKHCQKNESCAADTLEMSALYPLSPSDCDASLNLSNMCSTRSKSSLVSSSSPGSRHSMVDFSAGRIDALSRRSTYASTSDRNSGRTLSEANERTEESPGK